ncbi:hypothetical protein SEUBUCD646_0H03130 [Saccharomyces eubayanus]|uniref:Protein hua2 n=2 Tax=Saccharomyces TaxID=4930 RepID=A0A6C1E8P3_SACPS|nr:HUA2-like protein [Saccharomyces eubayanus]KOG96763.1 HUA2-like protein [Saccharomyces eubayanus]QID85632.1 Protein hua2 [Saccharomyces pastorianus]CAI2030337.1 hypothetical protein SEUBUCD650_0H03140 [Saccharomyces eubayanus]CAI2043738.1 hypothetical protein SEUBUCD646_0H03130 [Saccharomyces eubayanus]
MQYSKYEGAHDGNDTVVNCSEDEALENDRIILGYKKRLIKIEVQMQHLLDDLNLDPHQIEPSLIALQKHHDTFQQLLQERKNTLQGQNYAHQPRQESIDNQGPVGPRMNLGDKFMKFQQSNGQFFDEEHILRILQKNTDFKNYFQVDKNIEQKVLLLAMYHCLNGPTRLHQVLNVDGIIHNSSIRTILGKQVSSSKWTVFLYDVKLALLAHKPDVPNLETSKMVVRYGDLFPCASYFKDHPAY